MRLNLAWDLVVNITAPPLTGPVTLTSYLTSLCLTFFTCKIRAIIGMAPMGCLQRLNRLNIENSGSICLKSVIYCVAIIIMNLLSLYALSEITYPNL